jgi:hypothetical protein
VSTDPPKPDIRWEAAVDHVAPLRAAVDWTDSQIYVDLVEPGASVLVTTQPRYNAELAVVPLRARVFDHTDKKGT